MGKIKAQKTSDEIFTTEDRQRSIQGDRKEDVVGAESMMVKRFDIDD